MLNTTLGQKQHMSQSFVEGVRVPMTMVKTGPCVVTQIIKHTDNTWSIQLGFGTRNLKNIKRPQIGHFKKTKITNDKSQTAPRYLKEVRIKEEPTVKVGDSIKISDIVSVGDTVSVAGVSKGKGFAGGVKRWGFAGGPKTHGQSDRQRAPGSIGQGTTPGRVRKGKKMAGRMGGAMTTVSNLKVIAVDPETDMVAISGAIPGYRESLLVITKTKTSDNSQEKVQPETTDDHQEETEQETAEVKEGESNES